MGVVAVPTPRGITLIGDDDELRSHLVALVAQGRLTQDGFLGQGRTPDGRYFVRVRLLDAVPRRRVRRSVLVGGVVASGVLITAAVWVAVVAVAWVVGHLAAVMFALALAGLAFIGLGQVGACPGIHCPGCKHR